MKNLALLFSILICTVLTVNAQNLPVNVINQPAKSVLKPTLGVVIYSNDAESVWNALRLANFSAAKGDTVAVFLLGKGVEALTIEDKNFDIKQQADAFVAKGGQILACGTCVKMRKDMVLNQCPVSNLSTLYEIISNSKKVITF